MNHFALALPCRSWRRVRCGTVVLLIVGTAGCDGDDRLDETTLADTIPSIVQSPADTSTRGPASVQPGAQEITANLVEWNVELSDDTVAAGPMTFRAANAGTVEHALEVEGQGIEEETEELQPGGSETLTVNLSPGTYEVYCPVVADGVSHREQGMTTTLVVQ